MILYTLKKIKIQKCFQEEVGSLKILVYFVIFDKCNELVITG